MRFLVPEVRPLVSADSDRGCRRHIYRASIAGKGPPLQPLQGPSVHFYANHLDTMGTSPGISHMLQKPGCKRGQCALMGSAPTGRGEYPVPVCGGYSPRRGHSMANIKAATVERLMVAQSKGKLQSSSATKIGESVKLPPIHRAGRPKRGKSDHIMLVRLPHWPEGVAKRGN
mmetsp:Transcript_63411/g.100845  ORF Transcript_63411/g.100845 Transcript_63411/m.100845 type:complete len:172 (+) Transcript_63411:28-543(+)